MLSLTMSKLQIKNDCLNALLYIKYVAIEWSKQPSKKIG